MHYQWSVSSVGNASPGLVDPDEDRDKNLDDRSYFGVTSLTWFGVLEMDKRKEGCAYQKKDWISHTYIHIS